jgi:phenylalanyl-tRNA synthetase beta chain
MKISYQWLKKFVDVPVDARKLADDLSMAGLPVESIESLDDDTVIELELTANRGDCLSHQGAAREAATIYHLPLKPLETAPNESGDDVSRLASVEISDPDLCYRYCARVVTGVKVGPSPDWLVKQLEAVGQRSINNVADITNYVLFELGHPLHAFDLDNLQQHKIIVRRAKKGERLTTLDGVERVLESDQLVIADAAKPVALAGVMGGGESEISLLTKNVLIESAWFLPTSIRHTARTFGLHTEASHRFERGTDIENVATAMNRCAQLIQQIAGGTVHKGFIDRYPTPIKPPQILLRTAQVKRHLGIDIDPMQVSRILESLQFKQISITPEGTAWLTPTWRNDVTREIDLIEEIARHYGYDKFPARMPKTSTRGSNLPWAKSAAIVKERLRALGYFEIISFPFLDAEDGRQFTDLAPVELANPLSEVAGSMQTTALPALLEMLRRNLSRGQRDVRLFEIGKLYYREPDGKPTEQPILVFGATGDLREKSLHDGQKSYGFFSFKGDVEQVLSLFQIRGAQFQRAENRFGIYRGDEAMDAVVGGKPLATFGALSAQKKEHFKIKQEIFAAEIDFEALLKMGLRQIEFRTPSAFPSVERDLSFILSTDVFYSEILETVLGVHAENLVEIKPFDRYRSKSLGEGAYSFSLHLVFQSSERTLVEDEVNAEVEKVVRALETQLDAKIRKET